MPDDTETQDDGQTQGKLVKKVDLDQSAESETTHFRKQLIRRPWSH